MSVAALKQEKKHREEVEEKQTVVCYLCENKVERDNAAEETIWNNPHNDQGKVVHFCDAFGAEEGAGDSCWTTFSTGDGFGEFNYVLCPGCDRYICERNPGNGYQSWFKFDGNDSICCACYQKERLENGQPDSDFYTDSVQGDFYDDDELTGAGYDPVEKFSHTKLTKGSERLGAYLKHALELIEAGHAVITQYHNLSILGDEGFVSMWTTRLARRAQHEQEEDEQEEEEEDCPAVGVKKRARDEGEEKE